MLTYCWEKILLEAELLELKANPDKRAVGTVIEAALDKGRGIVTTILVQAGTLRVGDPILAGCYSGRVKALTNERVSVLIRQGHPHRYRCSVCRAHLRQAINSTRWKVKLKRAKLPTNACNCSANRPAYTKTYHP